MVGFDPAIKNPRQAPKLSNPTDPFDPSDFEIPDLSISLLDPFPNFDSLEDWLMETDSTEMLMEENRGPDGSDSKRAEFGFSENLLEIPVQETHNEAGVKIPSADGFGTKLSEERPNEGLDLGSLIEEEVRKVSLVGASDIGDRDRVVVDSEISECLPGLKSKENESEVNEISLNTGPAKSEGFIVESDVKNDKIASDGESSSSSSSSSSDSESESDSSSTASSSSSSSSEEEEEKEEEEDGQKEMDEVEEGEIRDVSGEEILIGSDEDEENVTKAPIKSKNEIEVFPPVPPVDVTLEPHHQILPVGVILSIVGAKVIVEGLEKHNPLNEGSILWLTESRLPLGLVDEIFGPVKNPYYIVRYNSDQEVPSGICEGTSVSFVAEFASHVLNDQNLYKKGYDASGDNDEEVSDEVEFSDDEKEAEYRRAQRMTKKGANDRKRGNMESVSRKKVHHKGGAWKKIQPPVPPSVGSIGQPPNVPNQLNTPPVANPLGCGSCACSFGSGPAGTSGPTSAPVVSQFPQTNCCTPQHLVPLNGIWTNGMAYQPQQNIVFPNGLAISGMPCQQQNHHQHPSQMFNGFLNGLPMEQQFDPSQRLLPNVALPYGQTNFSPGSSISWPGPMGQAGFNQVPFGTGLQGPLAHTSANGGQQGVFSNESFSDQRNETQPPSAVRGYFSSHQQFNQGAASSRGSRRYYRGSHRFSGGRGGL